MAEPPEGARWNPDTLHDASGLPPSKLAVALKLMQEHDVISLNRKREVKLLSTKLGQVDLERMVKAYTDKSEHDREMLERMVFYSHSGLCRWKVLLEHFGEETGFDHCGSCDNCVAKFKLAQQAQAEQIVVEGGAAGEAATPTESTHASPHASFKPGDTVKVPRYGAGEVVSADSSMVAVAFPDGLERSFMAEYVHATV